MKSMCQNLRELCKRVEKEKHENNKKLQTDANYIKRKIKMEDKYKGLTNDIFHGILEDIIHDMSASEILGTSGAYEVFSEELNNEVLERYELKLENKKD